MHSTKIDLVLNDYTTVFVSSKNKKGGEQVPADQYIASSQAIPVSLTDVTTGEDIGLAYIKVNPALLDSVVDNIQDTIPVAVQIYNPLGKVFYHRGDINPKDHSQWIVRDTAYGYQIWVGIPTSYTVRTALFSFTWMISVALILVFGLCISCFNEFSRNLPKASFGFGRLPWKQSAWGILSDGLMWIPKSRSSS